MRLYRRPEDEHSAAAHARRASCPGDLHKEKSLCRRRLFNACSAASSRCCSTRKAARATSWALSGLRILREGSVVLGRMHGAWGRLRGGRSCLVFSTHDRAGEVKRTGGSEASGPLVRRRSGPRIQREGSVVFGSKCVELAVSNLHISTSGGLSAARPRTPYFKNFKLSKN